MQNMVEMLVESYQNEEEDNMSELVKNLVKENMLWTK